MTNLRAQKNLKRAISLYENKHHCDLMSAYFCSDFYDARLSQLVADFCERATDNPRFNCGYSVKKQGLELWIMHDDRAIFYAPLTRIHGKFEQIDQVELPEYAIPFIENADSTALNDEDTENIIKFIEPYYDMLESEPVFDYDFESEGFSNSPAFGLPTGCVPTKVWGRVKPTL